MKSILCSAGVVALLTCSSLSASLMTTGFTGFYSLDDIPASNGASSLDGTSSFGNWGTQFSFSKERRSWGYFVSGASLSLDTTSLPGVFQASGSGSGESSSGTFRSGYTNFTFGIQIPNDGLVTFDYDFENTSRTSGPRTGTANFTILVNGSQHFSTGGSTQSTFSEMLMAGDVLQFRASANGTSNWRSWTGRRNSGARGSFDLSLSNFSAPAATVAPIPEPSVVIGAITGAFILFAGLRRFRAKR